MNRTLALAALAAALLALASASADDKKLDQVTDEQFVMKASAAGLAEVNLGQMAADRGGSADVKKFGQHMVEDHTKANKELLALADKKRFPVATQMGKDHQDAAATLAKLQGAEFDKAYAAQMVKDHEEAVALFTAESQGGKDADLKAWAGQTLPTLKEHLQMARNLVGKGRDEKKP